MKSRSGKLSLDYWFTEGILLQSEKNGIIGNEDSFRKRFSFSLVSASKFLFIRPFKPPPRHVYTLFVGVIVSQNGRNYDWEVQRGKCLYFNRIDQMSWWSHWPLTSTWSTISAQPERRLDCRSWCPSTINKPAAVWAGQAKAWKSSQVNRAAPAPLKT